jgi:SnoaL-like protein
MARWLAVLLVLLCGLPSSVAAQEWDPSATVTAYSAALNAHDLATALALFDANGSATDAHGHNFGGRAGLTQFLLSSGFGSPDARISTEHLQVVANRAIWTYTCSCAAGSTEVRLVLNHDKISVFAMMPPRASLSTAGSQTGVLPWLLGLGLLAGTLAWGLGLRRERSVALPPRASQGHLLAALLQWRACSARLQRREVDGAVDHRLHGLLPTGLEHAVQAHVGQLRQHRVAEQVESRLL